MDLMAEVTRKLLLVAAPSAEWMWSIAQLPKGCHVHELPAAAELGRVAWEAYRAWCYGAGYKTASPESHMGQAILDALTKRRE